MKYLDLTLPTPAENLACDEVLLDLAEHGEGGEVLRCWESPAYFVVVGYANRVVTEVNVAACETRGTPILRRCSGGGTVLQGPGCLNYALILKIETGGPLRSIATANQFIMEQNRAAIESAISPAERDQSAIEVKGHTDLAINSLKFSGNSQRRRRHFLLFHGTILLNFALALVERFLVMPSKQPGYRQNRPHGEFLTNLGVSAEIISAALRKSWNAQRPLENPPLERIVSLAREKYATREWNLKF
jgi:lipoate---protein ligase